jgi:hypothetical protein
MISLLLTFFGPVKFQFMVFFGLNSQHPFQQPPNWRRSPWPWPPLRVLSTARVRTRPFNPRAHEAVADRSASAPLPAESKPGARGW